MIPVTPDLDARLRSLPPDEAKRLREVWERVPPAPPDADALPTPDDAWAQLNALLSEDSPPETRPAYRPDRPARPQKRLAQWARTARAPLAILAMLSAGVWLARPIYTTAPAGLPTTITLSDGSVVMLRPGTTLIHDRLPALMHGSNRAVRLDGEAFFDVATTGSRFSVEAEDARIEVLGTRFNVRAWPDERETTVTLVEGSVRLIPAATPSEAVVMTPNSRSRVGGGGQQIETVPVSPDAAIEWRDDQLVYKDERLGHVLSDVGRRFGVRIEVSPELRNRRVSVSLHHPASAEAVMRDLGLSLSLRYRPLADGFEIYPADPTDS